MARSALAALDSPGPDIDAVNLRRLLVRLEQQVLVPGPDSGILRSSFERGKIAQNVEYARTLLLRLEHNTPSIKVQARKHAQQAELSRHRALIKRLTERLYELNRRDDDVIGYQSNEEEEDIIEEYFAPEPKAPPINHSRGPSASGTSIEGLRARNIQSTVVPSATATSPTTGPSTALADRLFSHEKSAMKPGFAPADLSSEKQLEHQDGIQADITSLLVQQARQLKEGSLDFQRSLAEDEEIRARAEGAVGKSVDSLSIASQGMTRLRRMTEGRWFWQRYFLFIIIAVLWFVEIGIVFLTPKLRF